MRCSSACSRRSLERSWERRRLRRWVREYLDHLFVDVIKLPDQIPAIRNELSGAIEATQTWRRARQADDVDEGTWERLYLRISSRSPDLSAVLRSEAITAVPRPVVEALSDLERVGRAVEALNDIVTTLFERDVLPLLYDRHAPLSEAEGRKVAEYETRLSEYVNVVNHAVEAVDRCIAAYRPQHTG